MNPHLAELQAYPFERLAKLKAGIAPPAHLAHIPLSIGEPKHAPPDFVLQVLRDSLAGLGQYPSTVGLPELRAACASWLERRFGLGAMRVGLDTVLPVNGTREALFALAQAVIDPTAKSLVAMPNPFYQIYEGAALLAGATPYFFDTPTERGFLPDLDAIPAAVWDRVQLLYLCSPGNPGGAVTSIDLLRRAIELADKYDFVIASDECYAELYTDEANPPPSLLNAALAAGHSNFERCVVFHSLSKRSSLPGLRSGFVAGDPTVLRDFLLYRTYHGCAMPVPTQLASIAAWHDDEHVKANRALYREKFARVLPILAPHLQVAQPAGGFYLWPDVGGDDTVFTRELFAKHNVTVVPGSYLARPTRHGLSDSNGHNPGVGRVRISLVANLEDCVAAAGRIADFIQGIHSQGRSS
ncbi:MAG: succinyldiaminopimelate transaminase [Gammaproteobacteria bacterium]|nr:succinyldiaminopimelate transaminase [Gammaproteobacteria bacterium]